MKKSPDRQKQLYSLLRWAILVVGLSLGFYLLFLLIVSYSFDGMRFGRD